MFQVFQHLFGGVYGSPQHGQNGHEFTAVLPVFPVQIQQQGVVQPVLGGSEVLDVDSGGSSDLLVSKDKKRKE